MKLAVVGASGNTGTHVITQALARGHDVHALARRVEELSAREAAIETRAVDVLDCEGLVEALAGAEAIISTLGVGTSRKPTVTYSQGTRNIIAAMAVNDIAHLVVTSAAPAGPRGEQPFLEKRVLMPTLERFFGAAYRDMRLMEGELLDHGR